MMALLYLLVVFTAIILHSAQSQVTESQIVVNQAQDSIILPCFSEPWKSDVNNRLSWEFSSSDKERELDHTIIEVMQMGWIAIANMDEDHYDITEEQLKKGNLSMSLYNPTIEDSGTYTCNVGTDEERKIIASIEVHVPAQVTESQIVVIQAQDSIILPCFSEPWKRDVNKRLSWEFSSSDKEREMSHPIMEAIQINNKFGIANMDEDHYDITEEQLKKGNLSMSLHNPTIKDSGTYTCNVWTDEERKIKASIEVHVPAQVTESQIVVNPAQDSIILPCFSEPWKSDVNNRLSWEFSSSDKEREMSHPIMEVIQINNKFGIASMDEDHYDITEEQLKKGNLSMSLYNPTIEDSGTYTCNVGTDEERKIIASIEVHVPVIVPKTPQKEESSYPHSRIDDIA